ncbi:MAG: transcription elongation factor GreA [Bacteroidetes bacterium RIFCSPLOWO2_02_FULL_36_8]|nr:MAG: transcription elongation factor GreA [Bacteroidetes bacterium RIFCSPLOWO2_02_FULL_36_8]OFY69935.1 MAG: transcription elongation factor GreA [Bacteroidetes bacterium RIFCSPLOWO2_12_FULL_37_12]
MSQTITYLTEEGYNKLKEELNRLVTKERPSISAQIAEARDKGDLSENAEYDAAKNAQGMLEMKINKLQNDLANARILDQSGLDESKVLILSKVKVKEKKSNKIFEYQLVNESEADLKSGKISIKSPIGKALLGKTKKETVIIQAPAGNIEMEILEIKR